MAYTVRTSGRAFVRLINLQGRTARVMKPFDTEWICDPCARPRERYRVKHPAGWVQHAWYEVITNADDARTRYEKYRFASQVIAAAQVRAQAEAEYRKLVDGF